VLIDIDPLSGAIETTEWDGQTKSLITTRTQNVDALLDRNQAIYNSQHWRGEDNDFWFVASVPLDTLEAWRQEFNSVRAEGDKLHSTLANNEEWESFIWLRLNSSDFRKLRTAPVNV
jgi:hypothetical protein